MIKRWIDGLRSYLSNTKYDIQDRLFALLSVVALFGLLLAAIGGMITGESKEGITFTLFGFVAFSMILYAAFRLKKPKQAAKLIAMLLIVIFLPITYFTGGGIRGGTPIWFALAALYIAVILSGKFRIFAFVCLGATASALWYTEYIHPEYVISHTRESEFLDSLVTLALVTLVMTILLDFQTLMYRRETKHSEEQKKEIEMLNAAQNHFFSSMSHEIRTPVNTIIGLNEMILREDVSDEVAEDAVNIRSAGKMLLSTINDILDMSKIQAGQMDLTPTAYSLKNLLSEVVNMNVLRAQEKLLKFDVSISPDLPSGLYGDEMRVKQILVNVLNNAIKYTDEGSVSLSVQCEYSEEKQSEVRLSFTISDTGIGIKKESMPYLFSAFKRVDTEKNKHIEGTGLGLSIVKELVELMGGKINVNSVYTKGSTFVIEIPQGISDKAQIGEVDIESLYHGGERMKYYRSFEAPKAKALIVDDNEPNLMVAEKLLRDTKMEIHTAKSGDEALDKTLKNAYHIIFMDHMMPGMDGIECMHKIKAQVGGLCREAKIVALTANAGSENVQRYQMEGFDGYLTKPVSGSSLEEMTAKLLPEKLVHFTGSSAETALRVSEGRENTSRKASIVITTESVADIPTELIEKYNIAVIHYDVRTPYGVFKDNLEIEANGVLSYIRDGKEIRTTSPSPADYESFFAEQLTKANRILHLCVSGNVASSSFHSASEAARSFENVTVFDTQHMSGGQGIMVFEANLLASEGKNVDEITAVLEHTKKMINSSFLVGGLETLASMGQMSDVAARLTSAFMLRPVIKMKDGRIRVSRIHFGLKEVVRKKYIHDNFKHTDSIDKRILYITYAGFSESDLSELRKEIEKYIHFEQVIIMKSSPTIAANCGPESIGIAFLEM